jgi:putative membrane protein
MVDPRLLQANERTLLAWVRTSIALMTFGFVLARIGLWLRALGVDATGVASHAGAANRDVGTAWIGGVFVAMGVIGNVIAVYRYTTSRRAIRREQEIPDDPFPLIFAAAVAGFGAVIGVYLLRHLV